MFEHRTEVNGWLSVNPQIFFEVNNGQAGIFEKSKYRYSTQNRRIGAGTVKIMQCHRNETILQLHERGVTNYEAQNGVLALAQQNKYDSIITKLSFLLCFVLCNCTKEASRATLVDATGTVRFLLSVWSECHEMRISGSRYLRAE